MSTIVVVRKGALACAPFALGAMFTLYERNHEVEEIARAGVAAGGIRRRQRAADRTAYHNAGCDLVRARVTSHLSIRVILVL
jgi:hypothetical protein